MIGCDCCGEQSKTTSATCIRCYAWAWCHCGKKFCAIHNSEAFEAHVTGCKGWTPESLR